MERRGDHHRADAEPDSCRGAASFNNVFADNGVAIDLEPSEHYALFPKHGNNLLYGNESNYAGTATPGPGYVSSDPLFDASTSPPGLLAASPARGTADPAHAPATDYFGFARSGRIDLGAVQSSR